MWPASRKCSLQTQTQHSRPLTNENGPSKNMKTNYVSLLLRKRKCLFTSHWEGAHCTLPSSQSQGFCEAISKQRTQKHFHACQRKKDSLELSSEPPLTWVPQEWESRSQRRMLTQETIVWREYRGDVTRSVLSHFQGTDRRTCCISVC